MHCLAYTDSAPGACPRFCLEEEEASQEISVGVDVVWSEFPYRGYVSFRSVQAWWCLHRSMAFEASEEHSRMYTVHLLKGNRA